MHRRCLAPEVDLAAICKLKRPTPLFPPLTFVQVKETNDAVLSGAYVDLHPAAGASPEPLAQVRRRHFLPPPPENATPPPLPQTGPISTCANRLG